MTRPLVVLGCGFVGAELARLARAVKRPVWATARTPTAVPEGVTLQVRAALTADAIAEMPVDGADVVVAFPPDGSTDARIADALTRARAVAYISSTGVYGARTGIIDEATPLDLSSPSAKARGDAESLWRARGAVVLRAAGIYGPGRGLHLRLREGRHRIVEEGQRVVSRVHVTDLARLLLGALDRAPAASTFVVADDAPVPQGEVVRWLCERMGLAVPPSATVDEMPESLRHDRRVVGAHIQHTLSLALRYPTWREGFAHCLAHDLAEVPPGPLVAPHRFG